MDWFTGWPPDALIAVSTHFLSKYQIETTEKIKTQLMETMGLVHDNVAHACVEYFQRYLIIYLISSHKKDLFS